MLTRFCMSDLECRLIPGKMYVSKCKFSNYCDILDVEFSVTNGVSYV